MGIEPTCSAWKADVLPLNYTRLDHIPLSPSTFNVDTAISFFQSVRCLNIIALKIYYTCCILPRYFTLVEGVGFEPTKAEPTDLQSALVDRLSTPPKISRTFSGNHRLLSILCHILSLRDKSGRLQPLTKHRIWRFFTPAMV